MDKETLIKLVREDKKYYAPKDISKYILWLIIKPLSYYVYKLLVLNRKFVYYNDKNSKLKHFYKVLYIKKSKKYSFEFLGAKFGKTPIIYHQNVVVNSNAEIGDNCVFHGNNCIGNKGITEQAPKIGNNVDLGFGSSIIGGITLGDDILIGAHTLVNKSYSESNITIVGIPSKKLIDKK